MKLNAFLFTFTCFIFLSCTRDKVTVQVVRNPLLKFDYNTTDSWKADNVAFGPVSKVVVYPKDTSRQAVVYNRLVLNSTGRTNTGDNLQFIISFDVIDQTQLIGNYAPAYSLTNGLADVQLYNVTNSNNLSAYSLCDNNTATAQLQIQRQNKTERLISGVFQFALCNARDSSQQINIVNGTFTDIRY